MFTLLGDPVRFRIVETLASGAHRAGELADAIGHEFSISRTAVSHHLRTLRDAGFVTVHSEENVRLYRLTWNALDSVDRVLLNLYERWDQRYGWPYANDPLARPKRRHRLAERAQRPSELNASDVEPRAPEDPMAWWVHDAGGDGSEDDADDESDQYEGSARDDSNAG